MTQKTLTREIKDLAKELETDLVGIAPVDRWKKAPIEHSPQGILPEARSVIVCGVHIPDAGVELGAEDDVQIPGPAIANELVAYQLNFLSFRIAKYLQNKGYRAIPISQTGLWSYRPAKGAPRGWIADMSLYYAAAAAGLGDIGWHNICITPEYGPRIRFNAVITDALLEPDPMYSGDPLCDKCLLCAKVCPTKCFKKEVSGMIEIEIGEKKYSFPNRNHWRCAIGENFMLDIYLPWPEKIDEKAVIEMAEKAATTNPEYITGWNMGQCLKYCLPPSRRYWDRKYCKAPRRKKDVVPDISKDISKKLVDELVMLGKKSEIDIIGIANIEDFKNKGIDLRSILPDAESAIVIGLGYPENCAITTAFQVFRAELHVARYMENNGFSAITCSELSPEDAAIVCEVAQKTKDGKVITSKFGERQIFRTIITSASFSESTKKDLIPQAAKINFTGPLLTKNIKTIAKDQGADLIGIASVERMEEISPQLEKIFGEEKDYFVAETKRSIAEGVNIWGGQGMPFDPQIRKIKLSPRKPGDYLAGAKSVIVVGLHLIEASIDSAGMPPGEKAGHYMMSTHGESLLQISGILLKIAKYIENCGYKVYPSFDLTGLASKVYGSGFETFGFDSRDSIGVDLTACRFAAIAGGLGELGWNGLVLTPEFGARQRFATLITDAPLEYDPLYTGPALCKRCSECVESCPVMAISNEEKNSIKIDGRIFEWGKNERLRCDWSKRYGLVGEAGPRFMGSKNNFTPPETITPDLLCKAIKESDRLQRPGFTAIVEKCFTNCQAHK